MKQHDTHEVKEVTCVKDVLEALQPLPGDASGRLTVSRSSIFRIVFLISNKEILISKNR